MAFARTQQMQECDNMIEYQKNGKRMGVCNELQASVFVKNGWVPVDEEKHPVDNKECCTNAVTESEPPKRGRKPSTSK